MKRGGCVSWHHDLCRETGGRKQGLADRLAFASPTSVQPPLQPGVFQGTAPKRVRNLRSGYLSLCHHSPRQAYFHSTKIEEGYGWSTTAHSLLPRPFTVGNFNLLLQEELSHSLSGVRLKPQHLQRPRSPRSKNSSVGDVGDAPTTKTTQLRKAMARGCSRLKALSAAQCCRLAWLLRSPPWCYHPQAPRWALLQPVPL